MIVKLPFGDGEITLDLRGLKVRALRPGAPAGRADPGALISAALDAPVDGPTLVDLAKGKTTATVIVPDATRKIGLPGILPVLFQRLQRGGIESSAVTVLVACGTHPSNGPNALEDLVGVLPAGTQVVEHDCRDQRQLIEIGEMRPGLPLRLHRTAVESDLLVTVGGVRHHYFAGFGGGPKMVFPGVAGYEEIQANHALVIRRTKGGSSREPACEPGVLDGNPVAEEILLAAGHRRPDMALCTVEGGDGHVAWAASGPLEKTFETAVDQARSWFEIPAGPPLDLIVASGGGLPTDWTLIQAHKAFDAACRFLRDGGEILFVAAMGGGAGSPEMEPFLADPLPTSILARLDQGWIQYGHTTLRLVEKTSKYRVLLHSDLPDDLACRLGFEPIDDTAGVVDRWRAEHPGARVGVMANSAVYPQA